MNLPLILFSTGILGFALNRKNYSINVIIYCTFNWDNFNNELYDKKNKKT